MPTTYTPCPVYRKCGGCQLQNLEYPRQLVWKQDRCQKLLGRFGKVSPILGMECPYHYRNKVQAAFAYDKRRGRIISGVYQSSTHRIVPVDSCQTEDETADRIIVSVRGLLKDFKLQAYDENTGRGFLRHVLVKRGFSTGQVMVVLVTGTPVFT
ncbi:MAG TPA: 23S rRNA (uracil(1939)-C(5))-methyltransferase RlmD, partial [Candidatus Acutalibacter pullistercoris]|nr:23S rRNA (uracil(1939)-C(5))-methyltransferase RlmD [Candidatus Acutalibacter pullistercoris]